MNKQEIIARYLVQSIVNKAGKLNDKPKSLRVYVDNTIKNYVGWYLLGELQNAYELESFPGEFTTEKQIAFHTDVTKDYASQYKIDEEYVVTLTKKLIDEYIKDGITDFLTDEEMMEFYRETNPVEYAKYGYKQSWIPLKEVA